STLTLRPLLPKLQGRAGQLLLRLPEAEENRGRGFGKFLPEASWAQPRLQLCGQRGSVPEEATATPRSQMSEPPGIPVCVLSSHWAHRSSLSHGVEPTTPAPW
ncbi:hypothetical protein MC885_016885, partial [Smutsia gigantea]